MNAILDLEKYEAGGWSFWLDGQAVKFRRPADAAPELLAELRQHRDAIRAVLVERDGFTRSHAPAEFCPAELFHDAAVIADRDGCDMQTALDAAAVSAGFDGMDAFARAVVASWLAAIRSAHPTTKTGRTAVADALTMIDTHGTVLVWKGWSGVDLFRFHQVGDDPWHGIAFRLSALMPSMTSGRDGEQSHKPFGYHRRSRRIDVRADGSRRSTGDF